MLKTARFAAFAVLGTLAINPAFAEEKSAAMVNGVSIPQARIDMRVDVATAQGQPDTPELRKSIREDMINLEVLSQEAMKDGVDKKPEVIEQMQLAQKSVLVGAYIQDHVKKHPISKDEIQAEYDKLKVSLGNKQYKARHILVDSEDEAKAIIKQLSKKGKFDKLAKENSKDAGSAEHGGELDWAVPGNFVPPFANALLSLKKGQYTKEPVKSQFGWHIIQLDDERDLKMPSFDELEPQIQQRLQQQAVQTLISDLRGKAKIE